MRILHLIPSLAGGGAERQITYVVRGLRDLGCEIHLGLFRGGTNLRRAEESGVTMHWIREARRYDPFLVPRIIRLIHSVKPDIVQTWLTQMDIVGGTAAMLMRKPWILSERSSRPHYADDLKNRLRLVMGRWANAVISNSPTGDELWTAARSHFVVANALPVDEIEATPPDTEDYGDARVLLFVGRFDREKNLPNLIAALREVMAKRNVIALLCGAGPHEQQARQWIEDTGYASRFRILGFTDRVWSLMKRADALVAVSWYEGHPNAVIEAAAAGCPLVLSDIVAHRDSFDDSAALYAPPDDPAAIAARILQTLDDREATAARVAAAKRIAAEWSTRRAALEHMRIYEQLLAAQTVRRPRMVS